MEESQQLFNTVSRQDYLGFGKDARLDYERVAEFFEFSDNDLSKLADIARRSIRLDDLIPPDLAERLREIAIIANLVAEYFEGDSSRTAAWFHAQNPSLGNVKPRDMLRLGRFYKLNQFILDAREEAGWGHA